MQKAGLLIAPFLNDNVAISGSRSPCGKSQQAFSSLCQLQIADQAEVINSVEVGGPGAERYVNRLLQPPAGRSTC